MIFENISRLCEKSGISIARLEKETGLGNATIRNWESSSPRIENILKVAEYFKVPIEELIKEDAKCQK